MLATLRQEFVNCWLLAKDLEAIAARDGSPEMAMLCKRLRENYGYPVDSVLVATNLTVVGHVNVQGPAAFDPAAYADFLRQGLAAVGRTPVATAPSVSPEHAVAARPPSLEVSPAQPHASVLDVVRCRGFGKPSRTFYSIDATAFPAGGVLEIDMRVGRAALAATFELCAAVEVGDDRSKLGGRDQIMQPVQTRSVAVDGADTIRHTFAKGELFGLAVWPTTGGVEGESNAILVTVRVRRP